MDDVAAGSVPPLSDQSTLSQRFILAKSGLAHYASIHY
jgi:hypothetical protein